MITASPFYVVAFGHTWTARAISWDACIFYCLILAAQHTDLNHLGLAHQRWHGQKWVSNELFMNLGCVTRTFRTYWSVCNMDFERIQQSFGLLTLSNTLWPRKSRLADVIFKAARPRSNTHMEMCPCGPRRKCTVASFFFRLFLFFIQTYSTGSCGRTSSFLSVWSCKVFALLFLNLSFNDVEPIVPTQHVMFTFPRTWREQSEPRRQRAADSTISSCLEWVWFTFYDGVLVRHQVCILGASGSSLNTVFISCRHLNRRVIAKHWIVTGS